MGAKVDTTGIVFLEGPNDPFAEKLKKGQTIKTPLISKSKKSQTKTRPITLKPLKQPQNGLQGISSLRLVRELIVRHYKFVLSTLFWIGVGAVIVTLGR